jgi:tetratricopeptide (TPR) repeat protein
MKSEREQAYLNLINQLLTCPSGEQAQVLETQPELRDDGLVAAMLEEAENLRRFGQLNNANRLMNCAGILLGMKDNTSVAVTRKAEAKRLFEQGNQQYDISQFREALQSGGQALTIYLEIGDRQGEANSLGNLGHAYQSLGQFHRAIEFQKQSLEISREIGDRQGEAHSLSSLGIVYGSLGQYDKAIEFYQQSLEFSWEIGDRQGEANSIGSLGNAYVSLGQYQRAIEFYQQHLEISREIGDRLGESISLNNLGNTFLKTHQLAEAETAFRASIAIHETLRSELVSNEHKVSIFENQISTYRLLQKVLVAQTRFDEALEISEMSRTRAFVELLRQTLLTTPPQSPPYQGGEEELSQSLPDR